MGIKAVVSLRRNRHGEYVVKAFDELGNRMPEADYFTEDRDDAEATALAMMGTKASGSKLDRADSHVVGGHRDGKTVE